MRDILNKLEGQPDGDFADLCFEFVWKKVREPYKNSPVMGTQDFHYMGGYAKRKAAELGGRIYKGEIRPRPYRNKKEQPAIIVRLPMYVDLM
ncbi:MAG: hypothetical protein ACLTS6_16815 [Anaerobutyricum sp.]